MASKNKQKFSIIPFLGIVILSVIAANNIVQFVTTTLPTNFGLAVTVLVFLGGLVSKQAYIFLKEFV